MGQKSETEGREAKRKKYSSRDPGRVQKEDTQVPCFGNANSISRGEKPLASGWSALASQSVVLGNCSCPEIAS